MQVMSLDKFVRQMVNALAYFENMSIVLPIQSLSVKLHNKILIFLQSSLFNARDNNVINS